LVGAEPINQFHHFYSHYSKKSSELMDQIPDSVVESMDGVHTSGTMSAYSVYLKKLASFVGKDDQADVCKQDLSDKTISN